MNIIQRALRAIIFKNASPSRSLVMLERNGRPIRSGINYKAFATEGYSKSATVFRCINLISQSSANIPIKLFMHNSDGTKTEITSHKLLNLLHSPNPSMSGFDFRVYAMSYMALTGNTFLEGITGIGKDYIELWPLRPDRMIIKPGAKCLPSEYIFKLGGSEVNYPVDLVTGKSDIMHWKTFNPLDDFLGQSPMEAAAISIDTNNDVSIWNLSLIQNGGRPSGAIVVDNGGQPLQDNQREQLRKEVENMYSGAKNAGKIMLLEGGMDYKEMSLSPKEMEFINSKNTSARDICNVFGTPPQLAGIQGDSTYSNYAEARMAFYTDTVIPLTNNYIDNLNRWLTPLYGDNLELVSDEESIKALEPLREKKWTQIQNAQWLTVNEKRSATGFGNYEPTDDPGDKILVTGALLPLELVASDDFGGDEELTDVSDVAKNPVNNDDSKDDYENYDSKFYEHETLVEGKHFNIQTERQKRIFWTRENRKRLKHERTYKRQLSAYFRKEGKLVLKSIEGVQPDAMELAIRKALAESQKILEGVMFNNNSRIMNDFGGEVLSIAKSFTEVIETKTAHGKFDSFVRTYITNVTGARVKSISNNTLKKLKTVLRKTILGDEQVGEIEIAKAITSQYKGFSVSRALTIARTETHQAYAESTRNAAKQLELPNTRKEWISDLGETARINHIEMDGTKVGLEDTFNVQGPNGSSDMTGPGDPSAPAEQIINCKCVQAFSVGEINES